jgi:uncharacterized protein (TIGR03437 family)
MSRVQLLLSLLPLIAVAQGPPPGGGGPGGPGGAQGDGIWRRNAAFGESQTFDYCLGHQPGNGQYHYHVQPACLRAQLDDNIEVVKNSRVGTTYREKTSGWKHSPILGWALDGYPIYGPYGYSDPQSSSSAIKRVAPGYRLRNITARTSLPDWSLANHAGIPQQLAASQYGPAIGGNYPLGRYVEDYEYVAGLGDLDQYNGRTTVTPEFPNGTYAYFVTLDASGAPAFPYVIAGQYYGAATGGNAQNITGTITDYFSNNTYTPAANPAALLTSWSTKYSSTAARIVSGFDPGAGPVTTWPGVTSPVNADIQRIRYSSSAVYINANGMPGYVFGPWFGFAMNGGVFGNFPTAQNVQMQFPSAPAPATTRTTTGLGACGLWVNGVAVFNFLDGATYSNAQAADQGGGIVTPAILQVSAASLEPGPSAPNSMVAAYPIFGAVIASSTQSADSANWPTTLGGARVAVTDSAGVTRNAQISYASAGQINYVVPDGTATGNATVRVTVNNASVTGSINVTATYPNLFTVNADGLAAAYSLDTQTGKIANVFQLQNNAVVPQPVLAGTYLILLGSGLGSATSATATIGGQPATVAYGGPQKTYPGVDQYNILIPPSLAGKGSVDVIVTAAGRPSNTVSITVQ